MAVRMTFTPSWFCLYGLYRLLAFLRKQRYDLTGEVKPSHICLKPGALWSMQSVQNFAFQSQSDAN